MQSPPVIMYFPSDIDSCIRPYKKKISQEIKEIKRELAKGVFNEELFHRGPLSKRLRILKKEDNDLRHILNYHYMKGFKEYSDGYRRHNINFWSAGLLIDRIRKEAGSKSSEIKLSITYSNWWSWISFCDHMIDSNSRREKRWYQYQLDRWKEKIKK